MREYLPLESLVLDLMQPLEVTSTTGNYDVLVNVNGGGYTGQAQAIRHGIARALLEVNPEYRKDLKWLRFSILMLLITVQNLSL